MIDDNNDVWNSFGSMNPTNPQQQQPQQQQNQHPHTQNMMGSSGGMGSNGSQSTGSQAMTTNQFNTQQLMNLMASQNVMGNQNQMFGSNGTSPLLPNAGNYLTLPNTGQTFVLPNMGNANNNMASGGMDTSQNGQPPLAPNPSSAAFMGAINAIMGHNASSRPQHAGEMDGGLPGVDGFGSHGQDRSDNSTDERVRQNRDRNREHARSTRLRKKAYVQKLKELVEGLHAERTEEARQRRVAIQHLAEVQTVRRNVVKNFLSFLANYETDEKKWQTMLEDDFWLKQPVTPYRSFRRSEIEKECRCSRGVQAVICDAASLSVMIEGIGSRSSRWMQIKRDEFVQLLETKRGKKKILRCVVRQESRLQHAISSLSGSSNNASSGEDTTNNDQKVSHHKHGIMSMTLDTSESHRNSGQGAKKVSSSSGSGSSSDGRMKQGSSSSNDYHDYHAKPLPDPKLGDSEDSSPLPDESPEESNEGSNGKRVSTDSSSGDDSAAAIAAPRPIKRRKHHDDAERASAETDRSASYSSNVKNILPANIAKKGGISHNVRPVEVAMIANGNARLNFVPAIPLPPFAGIGKRTPSVNGGQSNSTAVSGINNNSGDSRGLPLRSAGPTVISADVDTSSNSSTSKVPTIRGFYHINEDDMILMENVLMCPFIFRTQDAVLCGALADCVMPGMLRAHFTSRNKLASFELIYDAMGFMQQLERASGNEGTPQIIPGSLEMALAPNSSEARVITTAVAPFQIVNVNEVWTRTTGYTQMEAEGQEYLTLLEGEGTVEEAKERAGKPVYRLDEIAKGRASCSTNVHYDKEGRDFIEFVCSYPLTNAMDQITHILHVSKELPSLRSSVAAHNGC